MLLKVAKCWKFFFLCPLTNGSNFNLNGLGESRYLRWPLPIDNPPTPILAQYWVKYGENELVYLYILLSEADTTEIIILGRHYLLQYHPILNGNDSYIKQGSRITSCGTCQFIVWWFLRLFSGVKPLTKPNCTLHGGMKWYLDGPIPFMIRIILFLQVVDVVRQKGL